MKRGEIRTGLEERTGRDGTGGVGGDKAKREGARQAGRNLTVEARQGVLRSPPLCVCHISGAFGQGRRCGVCIVRNPGTGPWTKIPLPCHAAGEVR